MLCRPGHFLSSGKEISFCCQCFIVLITLNITGSEVLLWQEIGYNISWIILFELLLSIANEEVAYFSTSFIQGFRLASPMELTSNQYQCALAIPSIPRCMGFERSANMRFWKKLICKHSDLKFSLFNLLWISDLNGCNRDGSHIWRETLISPPSNRRNHKLCKKHKVCRRSRCIRRPASLTRTPVSS